MNVSRQTGAFGLLLRLLDWFIPLIIRTDKVQRTRAYILVGIILVNLCVCALMAVMLLTTSLSPLGMRAGIGLSWYRQRST
jgi:hypothetical protein